MSNTALAILMIAGGLGTLVLRALFLILVPGDGLPAIVRRGLRYVPPSVLAALAVPAFLPAVWPPEGTTALVRPLATIAAALVAWRWGNVLGTIATGMAVMWVLGYFV